MRTGFSRQVVGVFGVALFFLLLVGCWGTLQKGAIEGEVWGENAPLEGVLVEGGGQSTQSDVNGRFLLEQVPAGDTVVFFSHPGYVGSFVEVEVVGESVVSLPERVVLLGETDSRLKEYIFTLYERGFYERALEGAQSFLSQYATSSYAGDVWFIRGASLFELGRYAEAIPALSQALSASQDFADDAQYLIAKSFANGLRDYGKAIEEYLRFIAQYPESELLGNAYYELGDCYYILGEYRRALTAYEEAQAAGGDVARKALYSAAHCLYRLEFYNRAAARFLEYVAQYPDTDISDDAQYFAGASFYKAFRYGEALTAFEDCVTRYPQGRWYNGILIAPAALFHKGLCLEKLGRYEEAYEVYLGIIRDYPGARWADGSSLIASVRFRIDWLKQNIF